MAGESLRVVQGRASGTEIPLPDGDLLLGRAGTGHGRLGDDPELSRRHALVTRRAGDQLTIEDLGSTNGTFVNERRVTKAQPLTPGDTIKLGTTTLQVLDASGNAPQATALATAIPADAQRTSARKPPEPAVPARSAGEEPGEPPAETEAPPPSSGA